MGGGRGGNGQVDLSVAASLDRIDRLLEHWQVRETAQEALRGRPGVTEAYALTIWGLAAHAHAQVRIVSELGVTGIVLAPLVRTPFECALTAQWIIKRGPKALPAFLNEGARQRLNLGKSMHDAGWAGMTPEIIDDLAAERLPLEDLDAQARQFHAIVQDFRIGQVLYVIYRVLSGFSHASTTLVDTYVREDVGAPAGISLRREAEPHGVGSWEYVLVWILVWSGRALDWVTHGSPSRHFYGEMAREAGMPGDMLALTDAAEALAFADRHQASRRRRSGSGRR